MSEHILSPSKITAWLDCAHYMTLRGKVDRGALRRPTPHIGTFARLLQDKGLRHEEDCLARYREQGLSVYRVPERLPGETFADWVVRIGDPYALGYDVLYQMPLLHDGVRGIADFLIRVTDPLTGAAGYEPVDAKLVRAAAEPGHVLQLCFYAEAIAATTGVPPRHLHVWLGSGRVETLVTTEYLPYWRRLRSQLRALLDDAGPAHVTVPEPCPHCVFCEFAEVCERQWRDADALVYVAGIRAADRQALEAGGVSALATLAECAQHVDAIREDRLERLVGQAALQVASRMEPGDPPAYQLIEAGDDPSWGRGLELLPEPDDGDVFLDFEGDPFWRTDAGLFFLFGLVARDPGGAWTYRTFRADTPDQETAATGELIDFLVERRRSHPGMHVYHYNHTERSALESLAADRGVGESALADLVETGLFVDLYAVVRNAVQVGAESYGLKSIERLARYERGHDIDQGAAAVVEYEQYMVDHDEDHLRRIEAYNEDDVRATRALRDWLVELRPPGLPWRAAVLDAEPGHPDVDELVRQLHAFGEESSERLLGDLLGYWIREWRVHKAQALARTGQDTPALLDDPEVIGGLRFARMEERIGKQGEALRPGALFRWPAQEIGDELDPLRSRRAAVLYGAEAGSTGYADVQALRRPNGEVVLSWSKRAAELAIFPTAVASNTWVSPYPKPERVTELTNAVLHPGVGWPPHRVSMALLRRELPAFTAGRGPAGGTFSDDLGDMVGWVGHLHHSYAAVQGPPGTGKTYRGARMVRELVLRGQRVGITAMSHAAIANLLEAVIEAFEESGQIDRLRAAYRGVPPGAGVHPSATYTDRNAHAAKPEFNVVAGTTWLFSNAAMSDAPVDVLVVDEAGQLALADAVAASSSAHNLVLLGDPLQLPQVAQASHPGGSGRSALQHVLGDAVTLPAERGVFLTETRRMHPDVCRFISEEIYEGRLRSHPSCARQTTAEGTGLRWLRARHQGRSTQSPEEAELVAEEIGRLLGTEWVDQRGVATELGPDDVMVVAPYNDQVRLMRQRLSADPRTRGVRVGTVDKFQGQEAPVVFFTMTTSAAADMPRGPEFLFSRNRLNVAVSRARCLAYLVCTETLLGSRARTLQEMRLISTLCSFVEYCRG